ncbi:MAG TPA: sensor histidine kinase [Candidatus Limnocylindrales bacterium]|nr:sensor histidine kinase [Candidatus Limnocylindrales bacterium]
MSRDPLPPEPIDVARIPSDDREARLAALRAEAKAALTQGANTLRSLRDRFREAYLVELGEWQALRDELDDLERDGDPEAGSRAAAVARDGGAVGEGSARAAGGVAPGDHAPGADARGGDATDGDRVDRGRAGLRREVEVLGGQVGAHQRELARLELALRNLEATWLFLERGDDSLIREPGVPTGPTDLQMRILQAQEAERSRLAQEVHDGPAQALTNAIFQVELIERLLDQDPALARTELRFLRQLLRRELGDVRSFITQLRPPLLADLGLDGAILDTVETMSALTGVAIETSLRAPAALLGEAEQTVVLRVVQEALQNVRKHAQAQRVRVTTATEDGAWVVEIADDGRGFDVDAVAARGRRSFGLQFMRERAELIGARVEVRSGPERGTVVRLTIPIGGEVSR